MSNKKQCLNSILLKLNVLDKKMYNITECIEQIKNIFNAYEDDLEEECPDVIESEKALVDAIEKVYIEELMTRKPEGEA